MRTQLREKYQLPEVRVLLLGDNSAASRGARPGQVWVTAWEHRWRQAQGLQGLASPARVASRLWVCPCSLVAGRRALQLQPGREEIFAPTVPVTRGGGGMSS